MNSLQKKSQIARGIVETLLLLAISFQSFGQDTDPPKLNSWTLSKTTVNLWDLGSADFNIIEIYLQTFDQTGTLPPSGYTNVPGGLGAFRPNSDPGQTEDWRATLLVSPGAPAGTYTVTLDPLRDLLGNVGSPITQNFIVLTSPPPPDTDRDGVIDSSDAFPTDPSETTDSDGDGVGNNADAFPYNSSETADSDGDGVGNNADAFPADPSESIDTDSDGIGNNADDDDDGDSVTDTEDAFPLDASEIQDTDSDGIGNNADDDDDGDSVTDTEDAFPLDASEIQDTDSDGIGDNADTDDDNDGYSDNEEVTEGTDPLDANSAPVPGLSLILIKAFLDRQEPAQQAISE